MGACNHHTPLLYPRDDAKTGQIIILCFIIILSTMRGHAAREISCCKTIIKRPNYALQMETEMRIKILTFGYMFFGLRIVNFNRFVMIKPTTGGTIFIVFNALILHRTTK